MSPLISNYRGCQRKSVIGKKNVLDESPFPFSLPAGIPLLLLLRDRGYSGQEKVFQASHEFALLPRNNRLLNLSQKKVSQHDTLRGAKLSKNLQWRHSGRILKSVYYNFRLLQKGRMTNEHFQKIAFSFEKPLKFKNAIFKNRPRRPWHFSSSKELLYLWM